MPHYAASQLAGPREAESSDDAFRLGLRRGPVAAPLPSRLGSRVYPAHRRPR